MATSDKIDWSTLPDQKQSTSTVDWSSLPDQKSLTPGTVPQAAAGTPTKSDLKTLGKKLLPTKEQLPELILGGGMAAATGGMSIPASMALTGLAAAGGEGIKQVLQRAGVFKGKPPDTMGEAGMGLAGASVRGAVSVPIGKAVNFTLAPGASKVTPEIIAQKAAAKRAGV